MITELFRVLFHLKVQLTLRVISQCTCILIVQQYNCSEMSQSVREEKPTVIVENIHLSSTGVSKTLASGSELLDCLLLSFARRFLNDLLQPHGILSAAKFRPHILMIGAPFDEDVATSSPA